MRRERVIIVGAGVAGLSAAVGLAAAGADVLVCERAASPGGKMREIPVGDVRVDGGPTVLTMRWALEAVFAQAGTTLDEHLVLHPADVLARHAWTDGARLDLHADRRRSEESIGELAGPAEARRYREFCERAARTYRTLEQTFLRASRPSPVGLVGRAGLRGLPDLLAIRPFATLWDALGAHFRDPRLRQLFGRYATYCGSSPFTAPATLMLVAHVEQEGVWMVEGGMHRLARALAEVAAARGARLRYHAEVAEVLVAGGRAAGVRLANGERIDAEAVIVNADPAAVAGGLFGSGLRGAVRALPSEARSLSAVTWALHARTEGFPLLRHNVFFSTDYAAEFDAIFRAGRLPHEPTVYVCAQDRDDRERADDGVPHRLLCLVNAPATGDRNAFEAAQIAAAESRTFGLLARCGLNVERDPARAVVTTPADFHGLFPATGGALYGAASHGWRATFRRPGTRTAIDGLYLAGGATHPGPGVPMAALSGQLAVESVLAGLARARAA